jgi:hypothetical protein
LKLSKRTSTGFAASSQLRELINPSFDSSKAAAERLIDSRL